MSNINNSNTVNQSNIQNTLQIEKKSIADDEIISAKYSIHDHHHKISTIFSFQPKLNQKFEYIDGKQINTATDKRKPSWLELLFDLVIITASAQYVTVFQLDVENDEATAPIIYIFKILPILFLWSYFDTYINRFGESESLFDTVITLLLFCIVSCIVVTDDVYATHEDDESNFKHKALQGIAFWTASGMLVISIAYIRVAYYLSEARPFALMWVYNFLWLSILYVVIGFAGYSWGIHIWFLYSFALLWNLISINVVVYVAQLIPWQRFNMKYSYIPLNTKLICERGGLLIIIAIGEVITKVYGFSLGVTSYGDALLVIILGFLFKFMYFDVYNAIGEDIEKNALQVNKYNGMTYMRLLLITAPAITLSHLYLIPEQASHRRISSSSSSSSSESHKIYYQLVFVIAVSIAHNSIYLMGQLHKQYELRLKIQIIPQIYRTIVNITSSIFLIILASTYEFAYHNQLIGITESLLGLCLLFEFLCQRFFIDLKALDGYLHEVQNEYRNSIINNDQAYINNPLRLSNSSDNNSSNPLSLSGSINSNSQQHQYNNSNDNNDNNNITNSKMRRSTLNPDLTTLVMFNAITIEEAGIIAKTLQNIDKLETHKPATTNIVAKF